MNDIFAPRAQPMITITNFENGTTFSPMDVFRNLFSRNSQSSIHFVNGKADEWSQERSMREELKQMMFGSWYSIGSEDAPEPTEEQTSKYCDEASEMIHFMLYNESSPLLIFKKSWRQFFVQITDDEGVKRKTLNVEKVEEFFEIGVTNDARRFAESFYLAGESQDWYLNRFDGAGMASCCFEETQLMCLTRYIKMVLNIYADTIHYAEGLLKEGQGFEEVKHFVSTRCAGVQGITDVVMADAKTDEAKVFVYKIYGDWCVAYDGKDLKSSQDSQVFECKNMVQGRIYAKKLNEAKAAVNRKRNNAKTIRDLQGQLDVALAKVDYLNNEEEAKLAELRDSESLARLLPFSK